MKMNKLVTGKEKSAKTSGDFIGGGKKNHMSGENHAGPQTPGSAAQGGAKSGQKFITGGKGKNNHMFGQQHADPAQPGVSAPGEKGNSKFAAGGKGPNNKMFGYTGSKTQTPR